MLPKTILVPGVTGKPLSRRDAVRMGLGFAAVQALPGFAASKEFWDTKPSTEWSSSEVDRLLTKSPWAKEASVSYNGGPGYSNRGGNGGGRRAGGIGFPGGGGGIGFPGGGLGYPGGGNRGGYPGGGYPNGGGNYPPNGDPGAGGDARHYHATVRWESAQPIQEALHAGAPDRARDSEFAKYYVIQVLGDLPDFGAERRRDDDDDRESSKRSSSGDDADEQNQRRLDMFKQYTKFEKKDGFLRLEKVEQGSRTSSRGPGTLFYFSRQDEVSADDRLLSFFTKMGPVEIKAKFTPKEMLYHGKLAV